MRDLTAVLRRRPVRALGLLAALSFIGALSANSCASDQLLSTETRWEEDLGARVDVRPYVTPAIAQQLDEDGQFVFATPAASATGLPVITDTRAVDLAVAFVQQFGRGMRPAFEKAHGGPVDLAALRPTGVIYGESPFAALPESSEPPKQKLFGPYYLVEMSSNDLKVLSVAVSAYNHDIGLSEGRLQLPPVFGNDFVTNGISRDLPLGVPTSPEVAVKHVATQTGALIDAIPDFQVPSPDFVPQFGRWRITLDRSVSVQAIGTERIVSSRVLYVDYRAAVSIPKSDQPLSMAVGGMRAPVRENAFVGFEEVRLVPSHR